MHGKNPPQQLKMNRLKFKTPRELLNVLGESGEYTFNSYEIARKMSMWKRLDLGTLGSRPIGVQKLCMGEIFEHNNQNLSVSKGGENPTSLADALGFLVLM